MRLHPAVLLLILLPLRAGGAPPAGPGAAAPAAAPVPWRRGQCCGLNCLYVLLRMHGVAVTYPDLADETEVGEQGSTMAELSRVAHAHGIDLTPMRATFESIDEWPLPAVVHLQRQDLDRHYVLLLRKQGDQFVFLDCTSGALSFWQEAEFRDKWSGYVLLHNPPGRWPRLPSWAPYAWLACGVCVLGAGLVRRVRKGRPRPFRDEGGAGGTPNATAPPDGAPGAEPPASSAGVPESDGSPDRYGRSPT